MNLTQKLMTELKSVALTTLYFGAWFSLMVLVKSLILAEYHVHFRGLSTAWIGALIVAKVVLLTEHVPLGSWVQRRPAFVDVLARTALYTIGVVIVLVLEKSFEGRHEAGGFGAAMRNLWASRDMDHLWANSIVVSGSLLSYNAFSLVEKRVGLRGMSDMFFTPLPRSNE